MKRIKDNSRRCAKCNASSAEDHKLFLHRFPKPGKFNKERVTAWAKFCYPEQNWHCETFQLSLHTSHKMLCSKHFATTAFIKNSAGNIQLHHFSIPIETPPTALYESASEAITEHTPSSSKMLSAETKDPTVPRTLQRTQYESASEVFADHSYATSSSEVLGTKTKVPMTSQPAQYESASEVFADHSYATSSSEVLGAKTKVPMTSQPAQVNQTKKEKKLYNRCRRNMRKICLLQKKIRKMKKDSVLEILSNNDAVQELTKELPNSFAVLLQGQLLNCKRKKTGRRWNINQKIIALRLFKRSPACYRLLRRLFSLPCQSTLKALLNRLPLNPGINSNLFDTLKEKAKSRLDQDNQYVLLFDEMSIRKNLNYNKKYDKIEGFQDHGPNQGRDSNIASHALVFMLHGIRKRVKQPLAYFLSGENVTADRVSVLIKEVLDACFDAGLNIAATVCDMDGVNRRSLAVLGVTVEQPYFIFKDHEIVALYDTPHLLKCFRNLFLKYNIECRTNVEIDGKPLSGIAKWSHIQQFYELDNKNPFFVFAPALTSQHLNPNCKQKMKVKLAAQVLSHTVSAGMFAKISQGELPSEALATVNFIHKMDQLFDCLNADTADLKRGKKYATNLSSKSPHLEYFKEMKEFIKSMKFVGALRKPPSQDGWIQTMVGVERLWSNLRKKYPEIGSLSTRRLQQDALENCFGCIRGNCGSNNNPTVEQFVAALKTAIISNLAMASSATNCEKDEAEILSNLNCFLTSGSSSSSPSMPTNRIDAAVVDSYEVTNFDENTGEAQACAYVCGYIIKRMDISCPNCIAALTTTEENITHLFTVQKEYYKEKRLNYASLNMVECVEKCTSLVHDFLCQMGHIPYIKEKVFKKIHENVNFSFLDKCKLHKTENMNSIMSAVFFITVNRFCTKKNRSFLEEAANSSLQKKIKILKHV